MGCTESVPSRRGAAARRRRGLRQRVASRLRTTRPDGAVLPGSALRSRVGGVRRARHQSGRLDRCDELPGTHTVLAASGSLAPLRASDLKENAGSIKHRFGLGQDAKMLRLLLKYLPVVQVVADGLRVMPPRPKRQFRRLATCPARNRAATAGCRPRHGVLTLGHAPAKFTSRQRPAVGEGTSFRVSTCDQRG